MSSDISKPSAYAGYRLCLTISHQYIDQLTLPVRQAVFGNVGTLISFRVGYADAEALKKEFGNTFRIEDVRIAINDQVPATRPSARRVGSALQGFLNSLGMMPRCQSQQAVRVDCLECRKG